MKLSKEQRADIAWWRKQARSIDKAGWAAPLCTRIWWNSNNWTGQHSRLEYQLSLFKPKNAKYDTYWWKSNSTKASERKANNERIIACCLIAAMIRTGDL